MKRQTIQRKVILDVITHLGHSTLDEIVEEVSKELPNISLATIYRNLEVLEDEGLIKKIPTKFKASVYENAAQPVHDHFICEECLLIKDLPKSQDVDVQKSADGDLYLSEVKIYYGICKDCLNEKAC